MRRTVPLLALALLLAVGCGTPEATAGPPDRMVVELLYPTRGDSARYQVSWTAGAVGPRQRQLQRYEVQVTLAGVEVYMRTTVQHPQVADTVALPWPEIDVTEGPYQAHVRAVDVEGEVSPWVSSTEWSITGSALPPTIPGDVEVDSIPPEITGMLVLPREHEMLVGEEFQLCAYAELNDGSWLLHADLLECEDRLLAYLSSQQALRYGGERVNMNPTGEPVRVRMWPRVVAVQPGHRPAVCSARLYSHGRLDYSEGCLEEAKAWAELGVRRDAPALRMALKIMGEPGAP